MQFNLNCLWQWPTPVSALVIKTTRSSSANHHTIHKLSSEILILLDPGLVSEEVKSSDQFNQPDSPLLLFLLHSSIFGPPQTLQNFTLLFTKCVISFSLFHSIYLFSFYLILNFIVILDWKWNLEIIFSFFSQSHVERTERFGPLLPAINWVACPGCVTASL